MMKSLRRIHGKRKAIPTSSLDSAKDDKREVIPALSHDSTKMEQSEKPLYQPLDTTIDSIRLLILQPPKEGEDLSVIRCDLFHVTFAQRPEYEALSYTWGNPTDLKRIYLNGTKTTVRENLYNALYNTRLQQPRTLWADAICIDQSNLDERRYQVGLMDYIFTRAICVLVWLGLPPVDCEVSFDENFLRLLNPIFSHFKTENNYYWMFHDSDNVTISEKYFLASSKDIYNISKWVLDNDYWTRLWVIQEIGLSMRLKVYVGGHCLEWDDLVTACPKLHEWKQSPLRIEKLNEKRNGRHGSSNRLEVLLRDFQYAQCADPRDKIFGFLGLAHDCQDGIIVPDYKKPLFELWVDVITYFCRERVLQNGASNNLDRSMRIINFSEFIHRLLGEESHDLAYPLPKPPRIVQARGAIAGKILHLGPTYHEMVSSSTANKKWRLSFGTHYSLPSDIQKLREANECYNQVLVSMSDTAVAKIRGIDPKELYSRGVKAKNSWSNDEGEWERDEPDGKLEWEIDDQPRIVNPIATPTQCCMFLGDNHQIGLAPVEAKVGDVLCKFWKTNVVVVVREEQKDIYRVVGRLDLFTGFLRDLEPVYLKFSEPDAGTETLIIQMDIKILSVLTC